MSVMGYRITPLRAVLLALWVAAIIISVVRLFTGLAGVTNLSDTTPWGIWKAWDVIVYVPLGAAGFTMAFVRYFFKAPGYEQIMRRAVIWAIIAYATAGLRLAFDIGLPWRIPYPIIFWGNSASALFEVAWCMFLYLGVLFFENIPRVMERYNVRWVQRTEHALHVIMPGIVLIGVLLSTMHQSTLGTIYMIAGKRLDMLWYHPWLNYLFLLTAIAAGLSVTILIEGWASRSYGTFFDTRRLGKLAAAVAIALSAALVWRLYGMAAEGNLGAIFQARAATVSWWVEILVGYVLPIGILAVGSLRNSKTPLLIAAGATVLGMILFRFNVVFTGMAEALGSSYFPAIPELLFSVGWTAGTLLMLSFLTEKLPGILGRETGAQALGHTAD